MKINTCMKFMSLLLALLMALSVFAACGGNEGPEEPTTTAPVVEQPTEKEEVTTTAPVIKETTTTEEITTEPEVTTEHVCSYDIVEVTVPVTCTTDGEEKVSCTCGNYYTNTLWCEGHQFGDWTTTDYTCTADGEKTRSCHCGEVEREVLPARHTADDEGMCTVCGEVAYTKGLVFELINNRTAYMIDRYQGDSVDVVVPNFYNGLPVTKIDGGAFTRFFEEGPVESIKLPKTITEISSEGFGGCPNLKHIEMAAGNPVYHSVDNCLIQTESRTLVAGCVNSVIPADGSVTVIGDYAFADCMGLTEIVIPDGITRINVCAFQQCRNLESITLPKDLLYIGIQAFFRCNALTNISIPSSIKFVGNEAFDQCYNLPYHDYENLRYLGNSENPFVLLVDVTIEEITTCTIADGTRVICSKTFKNCNNLDRVLIPESVVAIHEDAFEYSGLEKLEFECTEGWCQTDSPEIAGSGVLMENLSSPRDTATAFMSAGKHWVRNNVES